MVLSLSSWIYNHLTLENVMDRIRKAGYSYTEISFGHDWSKQPGWERICSAAKDHGVSILSVHCPHNQIPDMDDDTYIDYHKRIYESLEDAEGLVIVEHESKSLNESREIQLAGKLRDIAIDGGLVVSFENLKAAPDVLERIIRGANISFTFDLDHAVNSGHDPREFQPLLNRLVNVHALDNIRGLPLGHAIPCGLGEIDWHNAFRMFAVANYDGPVTVEMNMQNMKRILEICRHVYTKTCGSEHANRFDLDLEDAFAIYARKYLSSRISEISSRS